MTSFPIITDEATAAESEPTSWRIGLVGAHRRDEFQRVLIDLRSVVSPAVTWIEAGTLPQLIGSWGTHPPDFIVVCQSWSDEFTSSEITQLFAAAPLARTVVVLGAWCAADGRTRTRWPVALRVPWWAAAERIRRELAMLDRGSPLPWTATREEVVLLDASDVAPPVTLAGRQIGILTADPAYAPWLRELIHDAGGQTAWWRSIADVSATSDALVVDADPLDESTLEALVTCAAPRPVIALIGEPNADQQQRLLDLGIVRVVSKLASINVLPAVLASVG